MSVTTEIQRINGGKNAIRTLASKKNVNIPSTALIDSYASVLGAQWPDCTLNVNYDGDKIRGKTVKWNQLLIGNRHSNAGITFEPTAGKTHIYGTATAGSYWNNRRLGFQSVSGHKYLFHSNGVPTDEQTIIRGTFVGGADVIFTNTTLIATGSGGIFEMGGQFTNGKTYDFYADVFGIDLTVIFGAGNEPASTSDPRVQFLIQYAKDRPEYDAVSLVYSFYKGTKLGEYDYIDTTNNKLVLGGAEVDISQMSLTRFLFGSNYLFYGTNNDQETNTTNVISADYQTAANITDIPDMSVTGNGGTGKTLWFRDDSCTTVEQFKTKNAGKKVYFKLATPTEIDL